MKSWSEEIPESLSLPHQPEFQEDSPGRGWSLLRGVAVQLLCMTLSASIVLNLFSPNVQWSVLLILLAVVILSLRHLGGLLILSLVQADLALAEGQTGGALQPADAMVYAFAILLSVMFVGRQRHTLHELSQASLFRIPRPGTPGDSNKTSQADAVRGTSVSNLLQQLSERREEVGKRLLDRLSSATRGVLLVASCSAAATYLVASVPRGTVLARELRTAESLDPNMRWAAVLVTSITAFVLVASELSWRRMTTGQARLFQRSQLVSTFYADFRLIVRQRIRARQKRYAVPKRHAVD